MNRPQFRHALAGLGAGTMGTGIMLLWLMAASAMNRRSVWVTPNLFATTFYGPDAYRNIFFAGTWSGLAFLLATYGFLGAIWGLVWREARRPFLSLFGAAAGLLVHWLFFSLVWKHANPLLAIYSPTRQLLVGHLLWGMMLARSPRYARSMATAGASE